ncbi:MAG: DUF3618 domain-containing protein [Erythrobacter sp.]|jgi:ElaB/YqjD/DUF883 family membrane-anchored ribosome-binding protein|nr:DUF3618 domain-containing protein [Erythrobacter sp.]
MAEDTHTRSSRDIERDIHRTQENMSRTVDQIGDQMTGRNLLDSLLDKADENGIDARYIMDAARRNPIALGLIAAGGIWLVSDSDARPRTLKPSSNPFSSSGDDHEDWHDPEHVSYVQHMAACERRADEQDEAYRRRRDDARASYFMIERRHDEDEGGFRKRLDEATDRMRERRDKGREQWHAARERMRERRERSMDSLRDTASDTRRRAGEAGDRAQDMYRENPLMAGLAAALVGAVAGSAVPASRTEERYLGGAGERAIDSARHRAEQAGEKARAKKDEAVDKAEGRMQGGSNGASETRSRDDLRAH